MRGIWDGRVVKVIAYKGGGIENTSVKNGAIDVPIPREAIDHEIPNKSKGCKAVLV
jgi:hypothetical protein